MMKSHPGVSGGILPEVPKNALVRGLLAILMLGFVWPTNAAEPAAVNPVVKLQVQTRTADGTAAPQILELDPARTAVVVVDMWDRHWCETYTARVPNLVPRMNQTLQAARRLGIQVVFAPSDVVSFYRDYPQRKALQAVPQHPEPPTVGFNPSPPPGPTDCCECGPTQPCKAAAKAVWTRQQAGLIIADQDLIGDCNNGRELLNLCAQRRLDTLIYMGVASNMCVQFRSMGLRNMKNHGLRTLVVADLVEAISSNGLDATGQKNLNFTPASGTARVQRHLEQFVSPTFESKQLLAAAGLGAKATDARPHVVFVSAEQEYETARTVPVFAARCLGDKFHCTFLKATAPEGSGRDDIPGLEVLADADLVVLGMRRRSLPVAQMDHLERYLRAGKPLVALRTSIVAFQTQQDPQPGYVVWDRFDREVLGCNYQGYNPKARATGCDVWIEPQQAQHPVLQGVAAKFHSPAWIYRQRPLADTATVLLRGRWSEADPDEPVAWTNTYAGGRVFYTTLGHPADFQNEAFQRLLQNAIQWALGSRDQDGPLGRN